MKILHTADWHLGDRLGRIDRTKDLQRGVERIAALCLEQAVDVLLVAGDLFSELSRPDTLRESVEHLGRVFAPFLNRGGTILAITGNHDNETFCRTLRHTMQLAAPGGVGPGEVLRGGRLYLADAPTLWRLADRAGVVVQFVMMPYPTPGCYLDEKSRRFSGADERNRRLRRAHAERLDALRNSSEFDTRLPAVLAAHLHVAGAVLPHPFRLSERESLLVPPAELTTDWDYVALGHVHQPQALAGAAHVRYSGSIERLDLGEAADQKSVSIVEVGPAGRLGEPILFPLPARAVREVVISDPPAEIPRLRERYPDACEALVRLHVVYRAGRDVLDDVLARLEEIFPYWYDRTWSEAGTLPVASTEARKPSPQALGFRETVLGYLESEFAEHPDRDELLRLAEGLLVDDEPQAPRMSGKRRKPSLRRQMAMDVDAGAE